MIPNHIDYPERFEQKVDFTELTYNGNIRPTDVDAFLEIDDELFIFIEFKSEGKDFFAKECYGQRTALERIVDNLWRLGKSAYIILATHQTECISYIQPSQCTITKIRNNGEWKEPDYEIKVKEYVDILVNPVLSRRSQKRL